MTIFCNMASASVCVCGGGRVCSDACHLPGLLHVFHATLTHILACSSVSEPFLLCLLDAEKNNNHKMLPQGLWGPPADSKP